MFASGFEAQEQSFKNRKTATAIAVTILIHAVLLLILFFTIIKSPIPPFEETGGGMAVNFGFDEEAAGETQPFSYNPGPMENSAAATDAAPSAAAPEQTLSQENEAEDVVAPKVEETKPTPKPKVNENAVFKPTPKNTKATETARATTPAENPEPKPSADPNAMFTKGAYGKPNNSKGDGTGSGSGDQGKPDGDPNSKNYLGEGGDGSGTGKGDLNGSYSLAGRKKMGIPVPNKCSTKGKVVITITVNREGKVTDAVFKRFSSTTFDDCNVNNALAAARRATFNADANAPETQTGTITYIYDVK